MRKKKFPFGKLFLSLLVLAVVGGGFWLSLERPAKQQAVEKPIELKLQPLS